MKKILIPIILLIVIVMLIVVFTFSGNSSENTTNTVDDNNTLNSNVDNDTTSNKQPEEIGEITVDVLENYPVAADSNFEYHYDTFDSIKIASYTGSNSIVVIPEEIDGKTVTAVASYTFANDSFVRAVVIPETVKELDEVFINNDNIEIVIAKGVENVGYASFLNCPNLHTVQLSNKLSEIGDCAFGFCSKLTELRIPPTLTHMSENDKATAFVSCSNLTIYGKAGSYIETVAKEQSIPFVEE